jgi:hypothetical protein
VDKQEQLGKSVDTLSAIGRQLLKLDAATAYARLVVDGSGNPAARHMLESISGKNLIDGPIVSPEDAAALLSALWLRHDWLDESHRISQGIESATGSFWHAIMHRREGDFSNSKYWYNRTEGHPVYKTFTVRAAEVVNPFPADKSVYRLVAHGWNPSAFVDLVQQVYPSESDPRHRLCVSLQELEWQTLFEHCTRAASGR